MSGIGIQRNEGCDGVQLVIPSWRWSSLNRALTIGFEKGGKQPSRVWKDFEQRHKENPWAGSWHPKHPGPSGQSMLGNVVFTEALGMECPIYNRSHLLLSWKEKLKSNDS